MGKKSRIKHNSITPDAYTPQSHRTEWTCTSKLAEWINDIIESESRLNGIGSAEVECITELSKTRADIKISESPKSKKTIVVVEAKQPWWDVFGKKLKEDARKKANELKAPYFATTNFKQLILWNTQRANNPSIPEEEQIVQRYNLSAIDDLDEIEHPRYSEPIKKALHNFLLDLWEIFRGEKSVPKQPIDEFLVYRLQEKIRVLSRYYDDIIYDKYHEDPSFAQKLRNWFIEQMWQFTGDASDFKKAARQAAYLLVNKILFYDLLRSKRPKELDILAVEHLTQGSMLQGILQVYFNRVVKTIDYETIYTADFIDQLAFPDDEDVVEEIKELISILNRYDFSFLGYDIIGRIFERLIPAMERHNLGQYFTSADVVDFILRFCHHHEDEKVFDPSCGAGTFLVRAYHHKKMMNMGKEHHKILNTLWGTDIAKFPAHLATINLAIRDLGVDKNYPNILNEDFFSLKVGVDGFDREEWRKQRAQTLGIEEREIIYPRWFDVIVGNPPYTRQEEMEEIGQAKGYKDWVIKNAIFNSRNEKIATLPKRAGIHTYFFIHGTKFLRDGGYFGFIVSNSWLDVDYGKGLQEFFLNNYKIIAIIESKVERWFEEADVNTCIVILQKCADKKERDENIARFVYLKKPLKYFIPPVASKWEQQLNRIQKIDVLKKTILAHNEFYENDDLRIFPKRQSELWTEGFDDEQKKYVGTKWGKYIRAPKIFFKILERGKNKLIPLKEVADVRRGFTTGANQFFYLTDEQIEHWKIEREFWMHPLKNDEIEKITHSICKSKRENLSYKQLENSKTFPGLWKDENGKYFLQSQYAEKFSLDEVLHKNGYVYWVPNYVIKSPRECKSIVVDPKDLKYRVLMIHKGRADLQGTNVLKYIEKGERKGFHKRPTCASRGERWYELKQDYFPIIWQVNIRDRFITAFVSRDIFVDKMFYLVKPSATKQVLNILLIFNSTLIRLFLESDAMIMQGPSTLAIYMVQDLLNSLIIYPPKIGNEQETILGKIRKEISERTVSSIFSELGASTPEEVSLDKVKPDRRELDKIIMGEILGLSDEEQLAVYRAVVDLVKSRIDKAKSIGRRPKKTPNGVNVDEFVRTMLNTIGQDNFGKFYRENILTRDDLKLVSLPIGKRITVEQQIHGWALRIGRKTVDCRSEQEARYIKLLSETGLREIQVPNDDEYIGKILPKLHQLKNNIDEALNDKLYAVSDKTARKLRSSVWNSIMNE